MRATKTSSSVQRETTVSDFICKSRVNKSGLDRTLVSCIRQKEKVISHMELRVCQCYLSVLILFILVVRLSSSVFMSLLLLFLQERLFLTVSNYIFTAIFVAEMTVKVKTLYFPCFTLVLFYRSCSDTLILPCTLPVTHPLVERNQTRYHTSGGLLQGEGCHSSKTTSGVNTVWRQCHVMNV